MGHVRGELEMILVPLNFFKLNLEKKNSFFIRLKVTKKALEEDVSIISHYSLTLPSSISPLIYSTIHGF